MPEYQVLLSLPQEDQPNTVEVVTNGLVDYTITGRIEVSFRFLREELTFRYAITASLVK